MLGGSLNLLLQWQEIDQNGFLASHVGEHTNIFGVDRRGSRGGQGGGSNDGANGRSGGRN